MPTLLYKAVAFNSSFTYHWSFLDLELPCQHSAMAAGILSSVAGIIQNLEIQIQNFYDASSSSPQFDPCSSIQGDVNKLKSMLPKIKAILVDAEEKVYKDEHVGSWLWELKGVAYDAEDVLNELEFEMLHYNLKVTAQSQVTFLSSQQEVCSSKTSLASRIETIRDRFITLYHLKDTLQLKEVARESSLQSITHLAWDSGEDYSIAYDREDVKRNVIEQLLSERPEDPSVISIVGNASVGKTMLIKTIYNDPRVCELFNTREWFHMSTYFDITSPQKTFLEYISRLGEIGAKYLIVIDDFSDENKYFWENDCVSLSSVLGSKIVLVTQSESLAQAIQAPYYHLNHLSENTSWQLFQRSVFESEEPKMHPSISTFAKKVVEQCKGLPLSLKMLGSLLRGETNLDRWKSISQSHLWDTSEVEDEIPPAVKISYFDLPPQLQICVAYCSLFPKDYLRLYSSQTSSTSHMADAATDKQCP